MTHHRHPYVRVDLGHVYGYDRRQLRRMRRTTGQMMAVMHRLGVAAARAARELSHGSH